WAHPVRRTAGAAGRRVRRAPHAGRRALRSPRGPLGLRPGDPPRGRARAPARAQGRRAARHRAHPGRAAGGRPDGRAASGGGRDRARVRGGAPVSGLVALYAALVRVSIAEQLQYRAANAIWILGAVLEPLVYLVVWSVVARAQGGSVGDYTT